MAPPTSITFNDSDVDYDDTRYTYDGYWGWDDEADASGTWTDE